MRVFLYIYIKSSKLKMTKVPNTSQQCPIFDPADKGKVELQLVDH